MSAPPPQSRSSRSDRLPDDVIGHLPELPSSVRYFDDFLEIQHSIPEFREARTFAFRSDGVTWTVSFETLSPSAMRLLRHVVADMFSRLDASTVRIQLKALSLDPEGTEHFLVRAATSSPTEFRRFWIATYGEGSSSFQTTPLKSILLSYARLHVGEWSTDCLGLISCLPRRSEDTYKSVRQGDCFIPVKHRAAMADALDEVIRSLAADPAAMTHRELKLACILAICFQMGVRRGQIARLKRADVRVHVTGAVHLRFVRTKQKRQRQSAIYVTRRVRREWCPLFLRFLDGWKPPRPGAPIHQDSLFGFGPDHVARALAEATTNIVGRPWAIGDFRHTGSQRLADMGASQDEIQDYLMHANGRTALVYFEGSVSQAARINQAMGFSAIYREVERIARTKVIESADLPKLPEANQVGGVPHGIPIAGIGACEVGQPSCVKNPILSCYTCRRFLPVRDAFLHRQVADDLRGVVRQFAQAETDGPTSAVGQLRETIEEVDRLVADLASLGAGGVP